MKRSLRRGCNPLDLGEVCGADGPSMKRSLRRGCNRHRQGAVGLLVAPSMKRSLRRGCNHLTASTVRGRFHPQ